MNDKEAILILGATSCIAEHVSRLWLQKSPKKIFLIARNKEKLESISSNLKILFPASEIIMKTLIFENYHDGKKLLEEIFEFNKISKTLIAFGTLPDQSSCQDDPKVGMEALYLNGLLAVIYCEILISKMQEIKYSKLAIIGSVAGDRGRKSNYFYGAAKSMIDTFVRGAQHRLKFSSSPLKLIIIKPGPTISPMTESLETSLNLADPKVVARQIVKGIDKNKSVIYAPAKWRLIMMVLKKIPSFIFNKIDL